MQKLNIETKNIYGGKSFADLATKSSKSIALKYIEEQTSYMDYLIFLDKRGGDWISNGTQKRRVYIPHLDAYVTIRRRWYENKHTGECRCFFDEMYQLEKYKKYLPNLELDLVKDVLLMSMENVAERHNKHISPTKISTLLTKNDYTVEIKPIREHTKVLFINTDGIYIHRHKNKQKELKVAVLYTGWEVDKKRPKLLERTVVPFPYGMGVEHMITHLEDIINLVYGEVDKVVIIGDGAGWITTMRNQMSYKVVRRYIDQYHFTNKCQDYVGAKTKIDWDYLRTLKSGEDVVLYLDSIKKWTHESDTKTKARNFIKNWFSSYVKCHAKKYINAIEAIQSHYIAPLFKYKRSFSRPSLIKLLKFVTAKCNNWNIKHLENDNNPMIPVRTFFDILESSQDDTRIKEYQEYQDNFPILFSGNKITADAFRAIIHGS